jgi:DNA-binding NarL/FixJ family response regulator
MSSSKTPVPTLKKYRILLVDDHPVMREGFAQLINLEPDLEVCAQASEAAEAMTLVLQLQPDIAVVDITLKGTNGIELIKHLRAAHRDLPVLSLSMHDESLYAERALRAGALGYVMKQAPISDVMAAIRSVLRREMFVSTRMRSRLLGKFVQGAPTNGKSDIERLSDRELEVFQLIGQGRGTREIAEELRLSIKTVETYRANIKEKFNLRTAMELVRLAVHTAHAQE